VNAPENIPPLPAGAREWPDLFPAAKVNEPMSRHTTWGIGGPADVYVEVKSRDELLALAAWADGRGLPLFPVGQGSNLLVGDRGLRAAVVRLRGAFEEMRWEGDTVEAGAGVLLPALARAAAERSLSGAEPFSGIPGTVGGGLMTNAGTPEGDIGSLVESVELLGAGGTIERRPKEKISFSYRRSTLAGSLVLSVELRLRRGEKNDILARMDAQLARRAERQPLGTKNCGSVFKNPPGDHAARLIEAAGLKGLRIGGVQVSPKHANFIENIQSGTAADAQALIRRIQETVRERFGVSLELEVWPVGE
jgi:UDP-N-acetylmuramate dehydrogenase